MHINDIENIMNYLFSTTLKKCGKFEDAEDLTSKTLLVALKYPQEIKDITEQNVPPEHLTRLIP